MASVNTTSGKIRIENDTLFWDYQGKNISRISVDDIFIIAEYTTDQGPFVDDWFFVFVNQKGDCKKISCYVDNFNDLLNFLSEKFHADLACASLANSTNWKTVVRYPDFLKGKPLFKFVDDKSPKSLFGKLKSLFTGKKIFIELEDEVQNAINNIDH